MGDTGTEQVEQTPEVQDFTPTPMYQPDDPPEEVDESPEGEPEGTQDAEPEAAAEGEAGEGEQATEGAGNEDQPEQGHVFDKGLQKLQQRQSAFEQNIEQRFDKITQALEKMADQGGEPATAEADKPDTTTAQQEQAQSNIDDVLKRLEGDDDDVPSRSEIRAALSDYHKSFGKPQSDPAVQELKQQLEAQRQDIEQAKAEAAEVRQKAEAEAHAKTFWSGFKDEHGFDGQPLWMEAQTEAAEQVPSEDPAVRFGAAKLIFKQKVDAKKAEPEQTTPAQTPNRKPPTSTTGTRTAPQGASGGQRAAQRGKTKPPMWVPD